MRSRLSPSRADFPAALLARAAFLGETGPAGSSLAAELNRDSVTTTGVADAARAVDDYAAGMASVVIVVAGVIFEHRGGRDVVLVTQRKKGAHLEGLWELPGGKIDEGEDPRAALVRERREGL